MTHAVERFFGPDSPLGDAPRFGGRAYEFRPQQRDMALAVASHLEEGRSLCVEAPTGVGKTFAYLVPAILNARARGIRVVVATHTISLQEQILQKDIPVIAGLLGSPFVTALAKGRSNYVCLRRLQALGQMDAERFSVETGVVKELKALWGWVTGTATGCLSDLGFEPSRALWDAVCCERGNCLNAKCPHFRQCFLMRSRQCLDKADLIVANHALFFSDLAMKREADDPEGGVLPAYGAVVLDEAHLIEDCAAEHLGLQAGSFALRRALRRLYHRDGDRGLLADGPWQEARDAATRAAEACDLFFGRVVEWLDPQPRDPLRYTVPGHIPNYLDGPLLQAVSATQAVARSLAEDPETEGRGKELLATAEQVESQRLSLGRFLDMESPGHVYWFERHGRDRREVLVKAVPVQVGELLSAVLFRAGLPVILTSATLAVRGRLEYFLGRVGATAADQLVLDTPFDYPSQVTLYIPRGLPNPNDADQFVPAAADQIRKYIRLTHGSAFVLFTSYTMMRAMAAELAGFFREEDLQVFVQGEGMPRSRMLEAFREDVSSVILGTSSFWTGVDVPGEALRNVIIVRLPFSVPDHPLVAARQEDIERRGGRSFADYALPEAVLRFRQGFGRLIRSRTDTGIVVVLDRRVVASAYGKAFLDSVPPCKRVVE
jgi:ATP-dependent DNA helicase DinG